MFFRPFKPPIRAIDIKNEKRETCSVHQLPGIAKKPCINERRNNIPTLIALCDKMQYTRICTYTNTE